MEDKVVARLCLGMVVFGLLGCAEQPNPGPQLTRLPRTAADSMRRLPPPAETDRSPRYRIMASSPSDQAPSEQALSEQALSDPLPSDPSPASIHPVVPPAPAPVLAACVPEPTAPPHHALTDGHRFDRDMSAAAELAAAEIEVTEAQLQRLQIPVEIARQMAAMLQEGNRLAERKAIYAAEMKFNEALQVLTQCLDTQLGRQYHTRALHQGLQAISEAEDFSNLTPARGDLAQHLQGFIAGHQTPVLQKCPPNGLTTLVATQRYHEFAYQQLTTAGGRNPLASEVLFACGQIRNIRDAENPHNLTGSPSCIPFLQAAVTVHAGNARAANELGVLLARCGRLREAADVLSFALQQNPNPLLMANLADVQERLGNATLAIEMRQQLAMATQQVAPRSPESRIVWVQPEAFKYLGAVPTASEVTAVQRMSAKLPPQPEVTPPPTNPTPQTANKPNLTGYF
ncbi:MAG: hypothetical protein AAGF97_05340 [Planctomycetota bacterium]